jgi:hypothetical protein
LSTKKRTEQQIAENQSFAIIGRLIPREWVIHDYAPDYGIDAIIEIFSRDPSNAAVCVSLGEVLFLQVKATRRATTAIRAVPNRYNVAKRPFTELGGSTDLEVVAYSMDARLLETVQTMGPAQPVLLLLVSLEDETIYFLCLNDYVDKVLVPEHRDWLNQDTVTIHIPARNRILRQGEDFEPFEIYSQRAKLYAAVNVFSFQLHELERSPSIEMIQHFLDGIMHYDVWTRRITFNAIHESYRMLNELKSHIESRDCAEEIIVRNALLTWGVLANLGRMMEDIWRENYLPTYLGIGLI